MKESTIHNKESLINDILKESTNNLEQPLVLEEKINNLKESTINKKQPIILKEKINNSKETAINKQPAILKEKINNLKQPTINFNPTPEWLKPKKSILNPISKDNKSFQYSITLSSHHKEIGIGIIFVVELNTMD